MSKIRFNTSAKSEFKDSLLIIKDGLQMFGKAPWRLFDTGAHRFPYAYIFIVIIVGCVFSITSIMQARSERDAAVKRAYIFEQRLDSVMIINDVKKEVSYVYHAY